MHIDCCVAAGIKQFEHALKLSRRHVDASLHLLATVLRNRLQIAAQVCHALTVGLQGRSARLLTALLRSRESVFMLLAPHPQA